MNAQYLVEALMQRTTALVAQLSATTDDKKRPTRSSEGRLLRSKSLEQGVLEELQTGPATLRQLHRVFGYASEHELSAMLNELVSSGLAFSSGRGEDATLGLMTLTGLTWLHVHSFGPITVAAVKKHFASSEHEVDVALRTLLAAGILELRDDGLLHSRDPASRADDWRGWDAVLNHFRAMAMAVGAEPQPRHTPSRQADIVGGATLAFQIHAEHPQRQVVLTLLQETRQRVNDVWTQVREYNRTHPHPQDESTLVTFYFGQSVNPLPNDNDGVDE